MDILIEELNGGIWAAALEKGRLVALEMDPYTEEVRAGSIYWAKVARIDKSLDAAFVNLDGDNIGILHNADVRIATKKDGYKKGGDVAIGEVLQPGQMIAVQAKTAFLADPNDEQHAKAGKKSPKLSMDIVFGARYTLFSPMENANRISKRIRDKETRTQMEEMLESLKDVKGCILRASAANVQTDILVREAKILNAMWGQIQDCFEGNSSQLIMEGPDAVQRMFSDQAGEPIERIEVSIMDHMKMIEEWCDLHAPDLMTKIYPIEIEDAEEELGLFAHRDIIGQIEALFQPYVLLERGGSLILQDTAAMTVVDVNSGGDDRSNLSVNCDAAKEIGRQIKLRNIGGIIIVDFLKMKTKKDHDALKACLQQAVDHDACTVQIHGYTSLGLVEMTRHRRTPSLVDRFENAFE